MRISKGLLAAAVAIFSLDVAFASAITRRDGKAVCTTPDCVLAAADLIQAMDLTADPCQDFFQFACGGWLKNNPIPDSKSRWTQFDILRDELTADMKNILQQTSTADDSVPVKQSRDLYTACMDTDTIEQTGLKPLTDLLGLFGGWPMTLSNWVPSSFEWTTATAAARTLFGSAYLLSIYNYLDSKNTSQSSIYVDQTSLGLPRTTLVNAYDPSTASVMNAYTNYITSSAKAIRDSLGSTASDAQIDTDVSLLILFESNLAKITSPAEDRRNNTRMYNPLLVSEVQGWTDSVGATNPQAQISWASYLNSIYGSYGIDITSSERVIVVETDYLKKLVSLLNTTPPRVIANYVHWRLVNARLSDTTQQMLDIQFAFNKVLYGTTASDPRWLTCTNKINNLVGFAISSKYVESFSDESKAQLEVMISDLKTSFKSLVDDAIWMDDAAKVVAREKADYIAEFIAYPDWIKNKTAVEEYYTGLTSSSDQHFNNIVDANALLNKKDGQTLRGPTDRTLWNTFPTVVNAFYEPEMNSITFPAGILQNPFYKGGRLQALNYGGIGVVIGHEITHGFDDQGRQSDKDGNTADWWTEQTVNNYISRAQCFIDQYDSFYPAVFNGTIHVNGINTQGENIADNGGLREAFRAYKNYVAANGAEDTLPGLDFTAEQLFFISYANVWCGSDTPQRLENLILTDPHSPNYYRVLGPLSNSADFAKEFNCPVGSPYNPANKCVIW
jgi:predicted metalloendopeptidase